MKPNLLFPFYLHPHLLPIRAGIDPAILVGSQQGLTRQAQCFQAVQDSGAHDPRIDSSKHGVEPES